MKPVDQKNIYWLFGSLKNGFLWFLNDPSQPGKIAKCRKTFNYITICNIKSIQETKLQKMAKNLYFGSLDHSKMHFLDFWMIQHDQKLLTPFSTIIICNMKSIRPTKLEKLTKDWRDHSKFIRVARKRSQKENQIFPGHAVFAVVSGKVSIFASDHQK